MWATRLPLDDSWVTPERIAEGAEAHPMVPAIAFAGSLSGEAVAIWSSATDVHFVAKVYRPGRGWGAPTSFGGVEHGFSLVDASMGVLSGRYE